MYKQSSANQRSEPKSRTPNRRFFFLGTAFVITAIVILIIAFVLANQSASLSLVEWQVDWGPDGPGISGKVQNDSDTNAGYTEVWFELLDSRGNQVSVASDSTFFIRGQSVWMFNVFMCCEATSARLIGLKTR
jgi:hypothetical protein